MQINARSEYAVRAVLDLSIHYSDGYVLAREIAKRQHIPPKFLPQILHSLRSADLLEATRGAKGGFRLRVPPGQLTVGRVIEAVQGPVFSYPCAQDDECELREDCPICGLWADARQSLRTVLNKTSFLDLAKRKNEGNGHGSTVLSGGEAH